MVSDVGLLTFLATAACFQLALTVDPAVISYSDFKDRLSTDALQRPYPAYQLNELPMLARLNSYKGVADEPTDKRFSEFLGGRRRRFSEFLGGKKRFSEFLGGRKRFSEFLGGKKRFSEFLGGKRDALSQSSKRFT